jgi:hypothetical protein
MGALLAALFVAVLPFVAPSFAAEREAVLVAQAKGSPTVLACVSLARDYLSRRSADGLIHTCSGLESSLPR